jgi:hypothetical protein
LEGFPFDLPLSGVYLEAMSVEELESLVSRLSSDELAQFSEWFEEFLADQWDRRIEQDVLAGRMVSSVIRSNDHFDAGRCTPL